MNFSQGPPEAPLQVVKGEVAPSIDPLLSADGEDEGMHLMKGVKDRLEASRSSSGSVR